MDQEKQRIAIANACGLKNIRKKYTHPLVGETLVYENETLVPNYLTDLNAIHEAEKVFTTTEQQNTYYANIAEITWGCPDTGDRQVVFNQLTATATQRAEAFLRTLNLWEE